MLAEAALVKRLKKLRGVGHDSRRLAQWVANVRLLTQLALIGDDPHHILSLQEFPDGHIPPRRCQSRVHVE